MNVKFRADLLDGIFNDLDLIVAFIIERQQFLFMLFDPKLWKLLTDLTLFNLNSGVQICQLPLRRRRRLRRPAAAADAAAAAKTPAALAAEAEDQQEQWSRKLKNIIINF